MLLKVLSIEDSKNLSEIARNSRIIAEGIARLLLMDIKSLDELGKEPLEIEVNDTSLEQLAINEEETLRDNIAAKLKGRGNTDPFWREDALEAEELELLQSR